jgi:hypothetical protein
MDALALASGKSLAESVERQVIEAYLHQVAQPLADLLNEPISHLCFVFIQLKLVEKLPRIGRGELTDVPDRVVGNAYIGSFLAQPRPATFRTLGVPPKAGVKDAVVHLVILLLEVAEESVDPGVIRLAFPDDLPASALSSWLKGMSMLIFSSAATRIRSRK